MVATINSVLGQIITDLEALAPPDYATQTYWHMGQRQDMDSGSPLLNRGFFFGAPSVSEVIAEDPANNARQIEWTVPLSLVICNEGRSYYEHLQAAATEGQLVASTIDNRTSWPAGVWDVHVSVGPFAEPDEESEDFIINFEINALCGETD